ncbi:MAG: alpha/beta hydrolase [Hyphomicrobiaceae bacterium]|nr:alpha/beta hydrolase [Hyphomicrobiaceae bacterium]
MAGLLVVGYLLLALAIVLLQRKLIYRPDQRFVTPEGRGAAGVETWTLDTPDGETIVAWYVAAEPGQPTVLYFHGNRGWIELRDERLAELKSRGIGVLMPSYRSYGGSTGRPTEAANIADAKLAFGALLARGIGPDNIVIFGESLGTGIAVQLATLRPAAALILDSPYTSMVEVARLRYPWLPVGALMRDRYESLRHLRAVTAPILVLHGGADRLVPVCMGQAVFTAAPEPKSLLVFEGAGHLDHASAGSFDAIAAFIGGLPQMTSTGWVRPAAWMDLGRSLKAKRPEAVPQAYVVAKV